MPTPLHDPSDGDKVLFTPLTLYGDAPRIQRIFYYFLIILLVSVSAGIIVLLANGDNLKATLTGIILVITPVGFLLVSRNKFEEAAIFLAVISFFVLTLLATFGLGIHQISNLGFPAVLIIASLVTRQRTLIYLTGLAILCSAWLVFGEVYGLYTPDTLAHSVPGDFFSVTIILIATSLMVRLLSDSLFQANRDLKIELEQRQRAEERLAYDALHDALTGLPNRTLFFDRLSQRLEISYRRPDDLFSVLFIDLDRFKVINDSLGHAVGDQMMIAAAKRLTQSVRQEDTVSRLSGDEFAVLLNSINDMNDAVRVAERIQVHLGSPSLIENLSRVTSASIGIVISNSSYTHAQELLRDADSAMYHAKEMGGGQFRIFDESMYARAMALLHLEADLKRAVENQEWQIVYQPINTLADRHIIGVEALVRWRHPRRGVVSPGEFIQVAEETGLIFPMGEYILRQACTQIKAWRATRRPDLWVSVNLSGRQFQDSNLANTIQKVLAEMQLSGDCLHLEITESVAMRDVAYSIKILDQLSRLGIQIMLDDFGIGYSSFGFLNRFPIKALKIDRSFIESMEGNPQNEAIVSAMISMSHALNLEVIAEGVETEKQLSFLQSASCNEFQGFLFSKGVPAEQLEKLL